MPRSVRLALLALSLAVAGLSTPAVASAADAPDLPDLAPVPYLGSFPHRMTADAFEQLEVPVRCTKPAEARVSFFDNKHHKWVRSVPVGTETVKIAVDPPPEVMQALIGHPLLVAVYLSCIAENSGDRPYEDVVELTVAERKPRPLARCTPKWQSSYRLSDLLGRGLPVPLRCDHATKVTFWLDPVYEEKLGIPLWLYKRVAVAQMERFTAPGRKTVRLRAQRWIRPYLRRARSTIPMTIQLGVQTDATDLFEVAVARTLRVEP